MKRRSFIAACAAFLSPMPALPAAAAAVHPSFAKLYVFYNGKRLTQLTRIEFTTTRGQQASPFTTGQTTVEITMTGHL